MLIGATIVAIEMSTTTSTSKPKPNPDEILQVIVTGAQELVAAKATITKLQIALETSQCDVGTLTDQRDAAQKRATMHEEASRTAGVTIQQRDTTIAALTAEVSKLKSAAAVSTATTTSTNDVLANTLDELERTKAELVQTKAELAQKKSELAQIKALIQ